MAHSIPVNNQILKWARETSGYSIEDVSRRMKKPLDTIRSWEAGESAPSYPQLEKLAYEVYKRPAAVFFFPSVPKENTPKAEFRTLPAEVVDDMPPEVVKIYKKAKIYQLNLKELYDDKPPAGTPLLSLFTLDTSSSVAKIAAQVRMFLGVNLETQVSWKNLDTAIDAWRDALTAVGIFVFKDAFHNDQFSGMSLYEDRYPVIVINNSMSKARQVFTIFHELGHLLFKAGGVDVLQESFFDRFKPDYYAIEQKCNEFAGEFLLPAAVFKDLHIAFSEEAVSYMADEYKVSRVVILRKYLNEKLIAPQTYKSLTQKWLKEYMNSRASKKGEDSGGNPYNTKKTYLGAYYINLAFSHYYQGRISMETLADYLGLKVGNVLVFEGYALR